MYVLAELTGNLPSCLFLSPASLLLAGLQVCFVVHTCRLTPWLFLVIGALQLLQPVIIGYYAVVVIPSLVKRPWFHATQHVLHV